MNPGIVLPRIGSSDVVLPERIDEHIRTLATHVNGGLTFENLAPTIGLTAAQFAERYSPYVLFGQLAGVGNNTVQVGVSAPGTTSKLLALGVFLQSGTTNTSMISHSFSVLVGNPNVVCYTTPTVAPYSIPVPRTPAINGSPTVFTGNDVTTSMFNFQVDMGATIIPASSNIAFTSNNLSTVYNWIGAFVVLATIHSS